jgi:hypothetical protein
LCRLPINFDERIEFHIQASRAVQFPLTLRIPGWCSNPQIAVNGAALAVPRVARGFVVVDRTYKPGDVITLTLPMKTAVSHWPQGGMGIERGPLVYSLPIKANWSAVVVPKYTTADFPGWNAQPASAWNYGLRVDPAKLDADARFVSQQIASKDDPWTNPPLALTVAASKIEGWELQANPDKPAQKFTPCLPDLETAKVASTTEQLTLFPYGSTQLRLTIFPNLRS